MAVTPLEHFLFRAYSVALKQWLIDNLHLSTYSEDNNVTIVYTTPDRAFAKYMYPVINGATTSPNINFHLTGIEYSQSENLLGFVREPKKYPDKNKVKKLKPPLVYKLTYSTTLYTRVQPEMDVLIYQLISKAHKNAKGVLVVDGQWAEIEVGDPRDETNLEPGEAQDVLNRYGVDITIPRAYLPLDYTEEQIVTNFDVVYDV